MSEAAPFETAPPEKVPSEAGSSDVGPSEAGSSDVGPSDVGSSGAAPSDAAPPAVGDNRAFWFGLWKPMLVGFAIRVVFAFLDRVPSVDETAYLGSGMNLLEGKGFTRAGGPELHFPPLIPALLGASAEIFGDPHRGAVIVILLAGTLLLVPMAGIGRRIGGDRAGRFAAWTGAIGYSLTVEMTLGSGGSEATYTLLVLCALWAALSVKAGWSRRNLALAATTGGFVGLAFLARPEGLWLGVVLAWIVATGVAGGWRQLVAPPKPAGILRAAAHTAVLGVVVAMAVVPYASYLHEKTGRWELTAKAQDASLEAWRAVAEGDRRARDEILYGLDETGINFSAQRSSLTELIKDDPSGYSEIVRINAGNVFEHLFLGRLMPPIMMVFALWVLWARRRDRATLGLVGLGLVPISTALAFFALPRYLVVTSTLIHIVVGVGLTMIPTRWLRPAAVVGAAWLLVSTTLNLWGPGGFLHPREPEEQRIAGEWIDANTEPSDRIITRSQVVAFYADRPTIALPYADPDETLAFGRHYGARYLVADEYILWKWRPQLRYLFGDGPWTGLRLVYQTNAQGRIIRIFEFDPLPQHIDDDAQLPTIAHAGDGSPIEANKRGDQDRLRPAE